MYVLLFIVGNITSPYVRSHQVKWYQAVTAAQDVQTFSERATILRYTHTACTVLFMDVRYIISGFRREVHENCVPYLRFGTIYEYHIENFKMGPIGCPETSVRNYHYSLRNNPEELHSLRKLGIKYR